MSRARKTEQHLARITLAHPLARWGFGWSLVAPGAVLIRWRATDRTTGEESDAVHLAHIASEVVAEEDLMGWLYQELYAILEHELAESFLVDGVRVFDPHETMRVEVG